MPIRIGHSNDPDDAFMVWALAERRIDTRGFDFELVPSDIQTLNEWALEGRLEVTALSLAAYPYVQDRYALLPHGASFGSGSGPIVVTREPMSNDELRDVEILVPGRLTTAFLVLGLALGPFSSRELDFRLIMDEVREGRADAGLLIHEGQLTYASAGLAKSLDLGDWWREETGLPLPLGVNAARRDVEGLEKLSAVLRESIEAALVHREEALEYALGFARDLDDATADRFVSLYVNELTRDYGAEGRRAVEELLRRAHAAGVYAEPVRIDFVATLT
jgi:1,4-dihydroxy-6-naphthoate synthase